MVEQLVPNVSPFKSESQVGAELEMLFQNGDPRITILSDDPNGTAFLSAGKAETLATKTVEKALPC